MASSQFTSRGMPETLRVRASAHACLRLRPHLASTGSQSPKFPELFATLYYLLSPSSLCFSLALCSIPPSSSSPRHHAICPFTAIADIDLSSTEAAEL